MKCVILQPSYIPWRGYFHQIYKADIFVFYDDVQYDKRGWRNRNRIKTHKGTQWLTIPVTSPERSLQETPINCVRIVNDQPWKRKHWITLQQSYSKAPYFEDYAALVESFYNRPAEHLADFTVELTVALSRELGIRNTRFIRSSGLHAIGTKTDRLLSILKPLGATHYITGPSAKDYLEECKFEAAGITLEYMVYDYPEYDQLYPPYDPFVTILDLLFMAGPQAGKYIW
jgi:hypothetical protein